MQENDAPGIASLTPEQVEQIKEAAAYWGRLAQKQAADLAKFLEKQITQRPAASLAAALAAGVILGWMVKRR